MSLDKESSSVILNRQNDDLDKVKDESKRIDDFLNYLSANFENFYNAPQESIILKPMNSYFRKLTHDFAKYLGFDSKSSGEEPNRHLVIRKNNTKFNSTAKDFSRNIEKSREQTKKRIAAGFKTDKKKPHFRKNDFGNKRLDNYKKSRGYNNSKIVEEYFVLPSSDGIEIILEKNGFIGLRTNQIDQNIIDSKKIRSGSFKIVRDRIVEL